MGIRAIEITDNSIGDAPMLPALLGQIPATETIIAVSGDGAYDTKGSIGVNHGALNSTGNGGSIY